MVRVKKQSKRSVLRFVAIGISALAAIWLLLMKIFTAKDQDVLDLSPSFASNSSGATSINRSNGNGQFKSSSANTSETLKIDENCLSLPMIQPAGSFFFDDKIKKAKSHPEITPPFHVGSYLGDKVSYHMTADLVHFKLLNEHLKDKQGGLTFDMGANQGFFTYFLAALGMEVHSFEISDGNFRAMQHGAFFNPIDFAKNVNLYPVGLGQKTARFSMRGHDYTGFMKSSGGEGLGNGEILGVTFDCFAYHSQMDLSHVAFVKLDVEGFEIAVLKGAQNSLFAKGSKNVGSMLMEVGPDRWHRASVKLEDGTAEMVKLSSHFENTYLILRKEGTHAKTCPTSLAKHLKDQNPKDMGAAFLHKISWNELEPLLEDMSKNGLDCNFWYTN